MAHAHSDVYATDVAVEVERSGEISITCGCARITMDTDEFIKHRDECSRLIVEAAQASAKAKAAESEGSLA